TQELRRTIWGSTFRCSRYSGTHCGERRCVLCCHRSPFHDGGCNSIVLLRVLRELDDDALRNQGSHGHHVLNPSVARSGVRALAHLAEVVSHMRIQVDLSALAETNWCEY